MCEVPEEHAVLRSCARKPLADKVLSRDVCRNRKTDCGTRSAGNREQSDRYQSRGSDIATETALSGSLLHPALFNTSPHGYYNIPTVFSCFTLAKLIIKKNKHHHHMRDDELLQKIRKKSKDNGFETESVNLYDY